MFSSVALTKSLTCLCSSGASVVVGIAASRYFGPTINAVIDEVTENGVTCNPFKGETLCNLREVFSGVVARVAEHSSRNYDALRNQFADQDVTRSSTETIGHSHPIAAANRTDGTNFITRFASLSGLDAYFYQCSKSDQRKGRKGSRSYYWTKDTNVAASRFVPGEGDIVAMVDVDYYVDMHAFLADYFKPMLLYTMQPSFAAAEGGNYSYYWNKDNTIHYTVNGGGVYTHKLWNYGTDSIVVRKKLLGITYVSTAYLIEKKQMDQDHQMVLLTPTYRWSGFAAWLVGFLDGNTLSRLEPVSGEYVRFDVARPDGMYRTTAKIGSLNCSTIPVRTDNAIASLNATTSMKLTLPQVEGLILKGQGKTEYEAPKDASATVLLEYHRQHSPEKVPVVFPIQECVRRYQFDPMRFEPDAKPSLVAFMTPMMHGAFTPDQTKPNEEVCVKERITKVKSDKTLTPFISQCIQEYAEFLIPESLKHSGIPQDDEFVYDQQGRPTQRRLLDEAQGTIQQRIAKVFVKKEAYGKTAAPRAITTTNPNDKLEYAKFIYSFTEVIKRQVWYAFGKTPLEIASRVADICVKALVQTANSDLNKFDGRVSEILRELDRVCMMRHFHPIFHDWLHELMRSQYSLKCYTTLGVKYLSKWARLSGSMETAPFNTNGNTFGTYLTFRRTKVNGAYLSPEEAWSRLGIYGGDDGLTGDIDPKVYKDTWSMLGQVLTVELVKRGCLGVKFLARVYSPEVWFGAMDSCCDVPRQLAKFHTTVACPSDVTPTMKLIEKARAFCLTDTNTPVIGDFCCRVAIFADSEHSAVYYPPTSHLNIWTLSIDPAVQYPNEDHGNWMIDYFLDVLPNFDYAAFTDWLLTVQDLDAMLSPPLFVEPVKSVPPPEPVVVDGEVDLPKADKPAPAAKQESQAPKPNSATKSSPDRSYWNKRGRAQLPKTSATTGRNGGTGVQNAGVKKQTQVRRGGGGRGGRGGQHPRVGRRR